MTSHTPGPWICYADLPSTEPYWHIVTTANKMRVLANVHIEPGNQMDEANASLITASPDLLDAARRIAAWIDREAVPYLIDSDDNPGEALRNAIAKAEGRS